MQIYTGLAISKVHLDQMQKHGLGVMISAISPDSGWLTKKAKEFPCALDNGAFGGTRDQRKCYDPHRFLSTLHRCYQMDIDLDFVVAPDRIGAGTDSLDMSVHWAKHMIPGSNLALALQDGMMPQDVTPYLPSSRCNIDQAARTAWKNKYDWLDAQLAEVACGQARLEQLLLGFAVTDTGETVYDRLRRGDHLLETQEVTMLPEGTTNSV